MQGSPTKMQPSPTDVNIDKRNNLEDGWKSMKQNEIRGAQRNSEAEKKESPPGLERFWLIFQKQKFPSSYST